MRELANNPCLGLVPLSKSFYMQCRTALRAPATRTHADASDLAFVLDCTGSMQRYITAVRDHVIGMTDMIRGEQGLNGRDDVRIAVSSDLGGTCHFYIGEDPVMCT